MVEWSPPVLEAPWKGNDLGDQESPLPFKKKSCSLTVKPRSNSPTPTQPTPASPSQAPAQKSKAGSFPAKEQRPPVP